MPEVITWTIVGGSLVFGLGLISAFEARRQNESRQRTNSLTRRVTADTSNEKAELASSMSMAAKGVTNGGGDFASISSSSR